MRNHCVERAGWLARWPRTGSGAEGRRPAAEEHIKDVEEGGEHIKEGVERIKEHPRNGGNPWKEGSTSRSIQEGGRHAGMPTPAAAASAAPQHVRMEAACCRQPSLSAQPPSLLPAQLPELHNLSPGRHPNPDPDPTSDPSTPTTSHDAQAPPPPTSASHSALDLLRPSSRCAFFISSSRRIHSRDATACSQGWLSR